MGKFFKSIAISFCFTAGLISASFAQPAHATAAEARAMLERAVADLKTDSAAAIAKFNRADGGFRDRDLYVACFDARTGIVQSHADPRQPGVDIRIAQNSPTENLGRALFDAAKPGAIATVDYEYPRRGARCRWQNNPM